MWKYNKLDQLIRFIYYWLIFTFYYLLTVFYIQQVIMEDITVEAPIKIKSENKNQILQRSLTGVRKYLKDLIERVGVFLVINRETVPYFFDSWIYNWHLIFYFKVTKYMHIMSPCDLSTSAYMVRYNHAYGRGIFYQVHNIWMNFETRLCSCFVNALFTWIL